MKSIIALMTAIILVVVLLVWRHDPTAPVNFSQFEPVLGFGEADEVGATRAFLNEFPIGTSLTQINDFYVKAGGRCYTLPQDKPDQFICTYVHHTYPIPLLPIFSTWAANIKFDKMTNRSVDVKLTAGMEGL
jgi:hypothetical protein